MPTAAASAAKSGPPQTSRKGIGGQHKAGAVLGFMCLPCLEKSFCVQPELAEFNWKSNSFCLFNAWVSECCFLGFGPSCCLCWVRKCPTPVLFMLGVAPVFWVQQSHHSCVPVCGRGRMAATAKHMSLSHHYLKCFSAFHSLSLLGVFTLVHENIQSVLGVNGRIPSFHFSFFSFFLESFFQA